MDGGGEVGWAGALWDGWISGLDCGRFELRTTGRSVFDSSGPYAVTATALSSSGLVDDGAREIVMFLLFLLLLLSLLVLSLSLSLFESGLFPDPSSLPVTDGVDSLSIEAGSGAGGGGGGGGDDPRFPLPIFFFFPTIECCIVSCGSSEKVES